MLAFKPVSDSHWQWLLTAPHSAFPAVGIATVIANDKTFAYLQPNRLLRPEISNTHSVPPPCTLLHIRVQNLTLFALGAVCTPSRYAAVPSCCPGLPAQSQCASGQSTRRRRGVPRTTTPPTPAHPKLPCSCCTFGRRASATGLPTVHTRQPKPVGYHPTPPTR